VLETTLYTTPNQRRQCAYDASKKGASFHAGESSSRVAVLSDRLKGGRDCRSHRVAGRAHYACSECDTIDPDAFFGVDCAYYIPLDAHATDDQKVNEPTRDDYHRHQSMQPEPNRSLKFETDNCPLVSCIMPTHNHRRFVPQAIQYVLRQDYRHRELLIVDDGTDPIRDLVPETPDVRYLRLDHKCTIGTKRNLACQEAKGEIIVHWDDDDWMATWRITYQVDNLRKTRAGISPRCRRLDIVPT